MLYDDDFADFTAFVGTDHEYNEAIYYNSAGLRLISKIVKASCLAEIVDDLDDLGDSGLIGVLGATLGSIFGS